MLSPLATHVLAVAVLGLLAAAFVGWVVWAVRRMPFTPFQSLLYGCNYLVARVLWRASMVGRFPVPPGQGAVIVCNHQGPFDPSFIALSVKRVVHWMVAREYCENRWFAVLFDGIGAIPVNRGGHDTAVTKMAIRIAEQGGLVGLFPEGRINTGKELLLPGRPARP